MNEQPKRKLGWRMVRWGLIGLAVLVTLAAALVTEENWRGKRAWDSYQREAAMRGEHLDMASLIPPAVPDDQNFFAAPIIAEALNSISPEVAASASATTTPRLDFKIYRGDSKLWPKRGSDRKTGKTFDLEEWQQYFQAYNQTEEGETNGFPLPATVGTPAADVLFGLGIYDSALEELRQAAERPYARMPVNYEDGFEAAGKLLPWLAKTKSCAQFLQLRIFAELASNQSDRALDDIKLSLKITDSINNPRFLISHLVRIATLSILQQPIWEGLTQHRLLDAQLMELERELAGVDLLADFESAMLGEKICAIDTFEKQRITREIKTVEDSDGTSRIVTISLRWMPSAYFYQNQLAFARLHREWIVPLVNLTNRTVSPAALRQAEAEVKARTEQYSPYHAQALMVFPAIAKSVVKFAVVQADMSLARVACALERYWLAHGRYPESLDGLAPQFIPQLPHDLINGQPLQYRRTADDKYVLYSVGWNETDDGGVVVLSKSGRLDNEKGDWVWKN